MSNTQRGFIPTPPNTCCAHFVPDEAVQGCREYIYNLIGNLEKDINPYCKLPAIRRRPRKLPENKLKENCKTMGTPSHPHVEALQPPNKFAFIKKHSKTPCIIQNCLQEKIMLGTYKNNDPEVDESKPKIRGGCCAGTKAPVPSMKGLEEVHDLDGVPMRCKKLQRNRDRTNWVERNAIQVIAGKIGLRRPKPDFNKFVDTTRGDTMKIEREKTHSGLEKYFIDKPTYGKLPSYLKKRKKSIKATNEMYLHYLNEKSVQRTDYLLTEEQRKELLNGLKAAWDRNNRRFLLLSASSTTLKNKAYKKYLESELDSLEQDIELVESHPYIFIEADKSTGPGGKVTEEIYA